MIEIVAAARRDRRAEQQIPEVAVERREPLGGRVARALVAARVGARDERGGGIDGAAFEERGEEVAVRGEPGAVRGEEIEGRARRSRRGERGQNVGEGLAAPERAGAIEPGQRQRRHRLGDRSEIEERRRRGRRRRAVAPEPPRRARAEAPRAVAPHRRRDHRAGAASNASTTSAAAAERSISPSARAGSFAWRDDIAGETHPAAVLSNKRPARSHLCAVFDPWCG